MGREVTILPHTIDRYGRTVAEVISDININLVLVEDGQAFAYRQYLGGCDAKEYLDAEYRASLFGDDSIGGARLSNRRRTPIATLRSTTCCVRPRPPAPSRASLMWWSSAATASQKSNSRAAVFRRCQPRR